MIRPIFAITLGFAALLGGGCSRSPQAAPNLEGLQTTLQKTAEKQLPAPAMSDGELSLPVLEADRAGEADRITAIARKVGGACLPSELPHKEVRLMVQIPAGAERDFRAQVLRKPPTEIVLKKSDADQVWIDITLRDPA